MCFVRLGGSDGEGVYTFATGSGYVGMPRLVPETYFVLKTRVYTPGDG